MVIGAQTFDQRQAVLGFAHELADIDLVSCTTEPNPAVLAAYRLQISQLPELVDEATLDRLFQRTRDGGAEIVALLKKGSAYYAPSASIVRMVRSVIRSVM